MVYCDVIDVRSIDVSNTLVDVDDNTINDFIEIASRQVDYYTKNSFTNPIPISIRKATSIIALYILSNIYLARSTSNIVIADGNIKSERVDVFQTTYNDNAEYSAIYDDIPSKAIALLRPYMKSNKSKPIIDNGGIDWQEKVNTNYLNQTI